jgi:serine/threonine-protein kinase
MIAPGSLIAGKFRIDRVLGQGGMGVVVAATHVQLGQRVAIKFLLPELCASEAIVGRFVREARALAQLRGEHVCRVSDVGTLDDGAPYIVMELLDGRDLASMLTEHGPVPVASLVDYVVQACMGLAEAHALQIVHRDLKPANLFLTRRPDGTPLIKLLDFGIAKTHGASDFNLTRTVDVMGSPGYMSPEQLRSTRTVDARSDVWALGVILYELASGRPPFTAETMTELTLRVAMDPPPALVGAIPRGFEQAVYRCLEKDPERRFRDVAQLAIALAPFGGPGARETALGVARVLSVDPRAGMATPAASTSAAAATTTLGASASSRARIGSARPRWGIAIGALAALACVAVGAVVLRGHTPATPTAAPSDVRAVTTATPPTPPAPSTTASATAPSPTMAPPDADPGDAQLAANARPGDTTATNSAPSDPRTARTPTDADAGVTPVGAALTGAIQGDPTHTEPSRPAAMPASAAAINAKPGNAAPTNATTAKPASAQPASAQPAQPTSAQSTSAPPAAAQPTQPTSAQSTNARPTSAKSTSAAPASAQSTSAQPTSAKPASAQSTSAKSTSAKPASTQPASAKPAGVTPADAASHPDPVQHKVSRPKPSKPSPSDADDDFASSRK